MTDLDYYIMELGTLKDELEKRINDGDELGACEILEEIDNLERRMYPTPGEIGFSL